ncbi:MAG TPA: tRNA-dihydrouridine synthase family protein [Candidatus Absconditabacterales bacterium]|nr:tRNA-dihydrouridine synthase family protein [Candidatus Absconditabacterales bacterium]
MDGITNSAYRIIVKQIFDKYNKNPDHKLGLWTEFMNADGYCINPSRLIHHIIRTEFETPLIAQIYGGNEDMLIKAAQDIDKKYFFSGIELNIGCPSPKVMACGGGAGMLRDKKQTISTLKKLSESIKTPFSIKTRAGLTVEDKKDQLDFILEAGQFIPMITIHGRTYKQSHSGDVDREFIYKVKKELGEKCKVIGNGGIKSHEQALEACKNLDGVMIGQAAIGNPWIFVDHQPSREEVYELCMNHLHLTIACDRYLKTHQDSFEEKFPMPTYDQIIKLAADTDSISDGDLRSVIEYRKYLFNYVTGLIGNKEFKTKVAQIKDYKSLKAEIENFLS